MGGFDAAAGFGFGGIHTARAGTVGVEVSPGIRTTDVDSCGDGRGWRGIFTFGFELAEFGIELKLALAAKHGEEGNGTEDQHAKREEKDGVCVHAIATTRGGSVVAGAARGEKFLSFWLFCAESVSAW